MARAVSATVVVEAHAEESAAREESSTGDHGTAGTDNTATAVGKESKGIKAETEGATSEDGAVRLRGNPLETTREVVCPDCRLPRLLYPLFGEGARRAPEPDREYCRKRPSLLLPGRDIRGRPFAIEKATKKKQKAKTSKAIASPSSPPSSPSSSIPHASSSSLNELTQLPGKVYVPSVKCPNCPRYFFLTRIAQHLDRCMGISTRQSSRNRTPMDGALSSTPAASQAAGAKRSRGSDGDEEAGVPAGVAKRKRRPAGPSKLRDNGAGE